VTDACHLPLPYPHPKSMTSAQPPLPKGFPQPYTWVTNHEGVGNYAMMLLAIVLVILEMLVLCGHIYLLLHSEW
jgi:hypothetical protein